MDGKPRILGVDDSLTIRKALEIVLKPAGYELELAADGAEAIRKAKSFKPALILLDFILPDMRGTEVCRQLAEDPETATIPVVLVSAKGAEIRQAYEDAGNVVSYIAKPFKPQVIISIVAEVLAKSATGELVKSTVPVHGGEGLAALPPRIERPVEVPAAPTYVAPPVAEIPRDGAEPSLYMPIAAAANGHDAAADFDLDEASEFDRAASGLSESSRREMLDVMFETMRAGLEGVFVEEVDTRAGAAADQAKSYTDLIDLLHQELDETRQHARSGARFTLYGDGSVRSLDESLLDVFRRSCRLLFRAVVAGAVENEAAIQARRILVACPRGSAVHDQVRSLLAVHPDWQAFSIGEGFRQLPLMTRLYGPTHVITEATWGGALWDQLRVLQRMPEARAMTVMAIASPDRPPMGGKNNAEAQTGLSERGINRLVNSAYELEGEIAGTPEASRGSVSHAAPAAHAAL